MGLTAECVTSHILEWEARLKGSSYPHRSRWPNYLFHHSPLENAVKILTSGHLLSRTDSVSVRVRDVAATEVIDLSHRAHQYVRLYFRPRTPTQYHIEGIRKESDFGQYGNAVHAPILIMFVFDLPAVLSLPAVHFSDSNMQSGAIECSDARSFKAIPFEKVYHEGGIAGDRSIISHRAAEVLAPSPLSLEGALRWIYCRSEAERNTLTYLLGNSYRKWTPYVKVSDDIKVFEKRFAFMESVEIDKGGIVFRMHPRHDFAPVDLLFRIYHETKYIRSIRVNQLKPKPTNANAWRVEASFGSGTYTLEVLLDKHLAYCANQKLGDSPF